MFPLSFSFSFSLGGREGRRRNSTAWEGFEDIETPRGEGKNRFGLGEDAEAEEEEAEGSGVIGVLICGVEDELLVDREVIPPCSGSDQRFSSPEMVGKG